MRRASESDQLRENQRRFYATIEQAAVGIGHVAPDGRWLWVNRKLCQIMGYPREELLTLTFRDVTHPDDLDSDLSQVRRMLAGEIETYSLEKRYLRKDGEIVWVNLTVSLVEKDDGTPDYFISVVEDINRRKASELALAASEERFHSLYRAMNEGVAQHELVFDASGEPVDYRILEVNPAFTNILGLAKTAVEDQLASTVYGQQPPPYLDVYKRVALTGESTHFETYYPPMEKAFSIFVFSPSKNQFATVFTDITGQQQIERNLKETLGELGRERSFLKSLIQTLPDLVWLKDPDGVYLACNPVFERLYGATEEEIVGKTDYDFVEEGLANFFRDHDRKAMAKGGPSINEEWLTFAADGHRALFETTKTPMLSPDGEVIGVLGIAHDITRRKRVEHALLESSQRYDEVLSGTKDGFWLVDPRGRLIEVNDAYCRQSGYSQEELLNMAITDLDSVQTLLDARQWIETITHEGSAIFETTHRRKDGTNWPVEVSVSYSPIQGGRLFCFLRDISERKEVEQLGHLRQRLTEMVYTGDKTQLLQVALDAAERLTGSEIGFFHFVERDQETVSLQTWSTRTLKEMCYAEGHGRHYPISQAGVWVDCIRRRQPVIHNDYPSLAHKKGLPEGHATVKRELTVPVLREDRVVAVLGVGNKAVEYDPRDVATATRVAELGFDFVERRNAEHELRLSKERLEAAASAGIVGVWEWDVVNDRLIWDSVMYKLYGRRKEDFSGAYETWFDALHPEDRAFAEGEIQAALRGERDYSLEFRIVWPDGSIHYVKAASRTFHDDEGKPLRMLGINYDITEQKRAELALIEARDKAEAANQAKSEFLATMSHEIRTPMNVVVGLGDMLLESDIDEEQRQHLLRMQRASNSLLELIDSILDLSKIEAGQIALHTEPLDPALAVENTADLMRVVAENKGLKFEVEIAPQTRHWILGDDRRLHQVLVNLIGNAIKFTEQGAVTVALDTVAADDGERLRLRVRDTGIGVGPEHLEFIFERFTQVDSSPARRFGGTGLGLTITRRLIELMEGRIWVESELHRGSTFIVELPIRRTAAPAETSEGPSAAEPSNPVAMRALRILMAEDSEDNQTLIETYLKKTPYTLVIVQNGEEAVARFQTETFDLILMDMQMPVVDGYEAARAIRDLETQTQAKRTPILALTAHALDGDAQKSLDAGCDGHLTKPIKKATLLKAIGRYAAAT